jgi:hypothetical protein
MTDRPAIFANAAQHLILDLDQVARIEKRIAGGEGGVAHRVRPLIERVVQTQGGCLVLARRFGQPNLLWFVTCIMPKHRCASSPLAKNTHSCFQCEVEVRSKLDPHK